MAAAKFHPQELDMTRRARWYLSIGGTRHFLFGAFAVAFPQMFASPIYLPVVSYAPLPLWGAVFLVTSLIMGISAISSSARWARVGLILSAASTLAIGAGILIGFVEALQAHERLTPIAAILLLSLAAKDFAVCTQPMCSPFESLLRRRVAPLSRESGEEQGWSRQPSGD